MLRFKNSVRVPKVCIIQAAVGNAHVEVGLPGDCWVTSGNDSLHMQTSKHYSDDALDFRTHNPLTGAALFTPEQLAEWVRVIKRRLGAGYDVVVEVDHLHVEFDEK